MHPSASVRRVHSAQFKSEVLAACQEPGASIAAVAIAHGLNANLVRKWLVGRGLKRAGLPAPRPSLERPPASAVSTSPATPLQFVPISPSAASPGCDDAALEVRERDAIDIELRRGGTQLVVRWPAAQAQSCAAWLREVLVAMPASSGRPR